MRYLKLNSIAIRSKNKTSRTFLLGSEIRISHIAERETEMFGRAQSEILILKEDMARDDICRSMMLAF